MYELFDVAFLFKLIIALIIVFITSSEKLKALYAMCRMIFGQQQPLWLSPTTTWCCRRVENPHSRLSFHFNVFLCDCLHFDMTMPR